MQKNLVTFIKYHDTSQTTALSCEDYIEKYDPCTRFLNSTCLGFFYCGQSIYKQTGLLYRAIKAQEIKIKQD